MQIFFPPLTTSLYMYTRWLKDSHDLLPGTLAFWDSCQTHVLGLTMTLRPKIQHLLLSAMSSHKKTDTRHIGREKNCHRVSGRQKKPPPSFNHHKLATLILTVGIIRKKKICGPFYDISHGERALKKKRPQAQFILIQNKQYYATFITIKYLHDNPWNISTWPSFTAVWMHPIIKMTTIMECVAPPEQQDAYIIL